MGGNDMGACPPLGYSSSVGCNIRIMKPYKRKVRQRDVTDTFVSEVGKMPMYSDTASTRTSFEIYPGRFTMSAAPPPPHNCAKCERRIVWGIILALVAVLMGLVLAS